MAKGFRGGYGGAKPQRKQQTMQQQFIKVQQQMQQMQEEVECQTFSAASGGGAVAIAVNGKKEITSVTIQPDAVDPGDVEMLQDLILSAANEALRQAEEAMDNAMNSVTGGLNIPGFGL